MRSLTSKNHCTLCSHFKKPLPPLLERTSFGKALLKPLPQRPTALVHSLNTIQLIFQLELTAWILLFLQVLYSLMERTTSSFALLNNHGQPSKMSKTRVNFILFVKGRIKVVHDL